MHDSPEHRKNRPGRPAPSSLPAYLALYQALREEITGGFYAYGTRLPSKRTLAADNDVSVITAEHALALLEEEGYIEARERSGTYVIYRSSRFFPSYEPSSETPSSAIPSSGEFLADLSKSPPGKDGNSLPPATLSYPMFVRGARKVLSEQGENLLMRSPGQGLVRLREVLSAYLARSRGIHVHAEQIIIGSGAEYLYGLVVQILGRKAVYGLEDPSYEKIRKVYEANGVSCDLLKMGRGGIRSSELARTKAQVLHVTPFHSYPSGITADASKRQEYLVWASSRGAMIVEDDADSEFFLSGRTIRTLFSLEPERSCIYINTFTRTIAPSMRLGYMVLPAERAEEFREKIGFYSCPVPVFEQYLLAEILDSGEFERHINRVRRSMRR